MKPYYETDNGVLYQGDCLEVMQGMPDSSVDMVLTDPPYGTTACKWDSIIPLEPMWEQLKRVIKKNGAIVLTTSQPFTTTLISSNMGMFKYEWIWEKSNGGGFLNANRQPLKRHENVVIFSAKPALYVPQKGEGKPYTCRSSSAGETTQDQTVAGWVTVNKGGRYPTTVLKFKNDTGFHPTQKPVALMEYLIKTYTNEGEIVLDFCMGSGTTAVACEKLTRKWIGIEKDESYVEIAAKRIEWETRQGSMF